MHQTDKSCSQKKLDFDKWFDYIHIRSRIYIIIFN
jgi:hypothetical protein